MKFLAIFSLSLMFLQTPAAYASSQEQNPNSPQTVRLSEASPERAKRANQQLPTLSLDAASPSLGLDMIRLFTVGVPTSKSSRVRLNVSPTELGVSFVPRW